MNLAIVQSFIVAYVLPFEPYLMLQGSSVDNRMDNFSFIHYKTLAAYRRLFLPLSGVFFRRNNATAFLQIAEKKRGKVAHRRFYKRRRVPTNAETRDAENNIIFRHTGVSRNAGMSIILIIDIPAF